MAIIDRRDLRKVMELTSEIGGRNAETSVWRIRQVDDSIEVTFSPVNSCESALSRSIPLLGKDSDKLTMMIGPGLLRAVQEARSKTIDLFGIDEVKMLSDGVLTSLTTCPDDRFVERVTNRTWIRKGIVNVERLRSGIEFALPMTANSDWPLLGGVHLKRSDDVLQIIGTDSCALAVSSLHDPGPDFSMTLECRFAKAIHAATKWLGGNVVLSVSEDRVLLEGDSWWATSRGVYGFPKMPAEEPKIGFVDVSANDFCVAIDQVLALDPRLGLMTMKTREEKMDITVYRHGMTLDVEIPTLRQEGPVKKMVLSGIYLKIGLKALGVSSHGTVRIACGKPERPIAVTDPSRPERCLILMPARHARG